MELATGTNLLTYVTRSDKGFLNESLAANIMRDLFEATEYIHRAGIIHRDLKPENIMVDIQNEKDLKSLKIIDFGYATYIQELKKSKFCLGTLNYMAPEAFTDNCDQRADIFALGVIFYFILSGTLPFQSDINEVVIRNTINCHLNINTDEAFQSKSEEAKDLIRQMIVKNPKERISLQDALLHPWILAKAKKK